eukprot:gene5946-6636_t
MARSNKQIDINELFEHDNDADDESSAQRSFDSSDSFQELSQQQRPNQNQVLIDLGSPLSSSSCHNMLRKQKHIQDVDLPVFDSDNDERDGSGKENGDNEDVPTEKKEVLSRKYYGHPKLGHMCSSNSSTSTSDLENDNQNRKRSAVDGLLFEIYERYTTREFGKSIDSDNITECSTTSSSMYVASCMENDDNSEIFDRAFLETKDVSDLERFLKNLKRSSNMMSSKLVKLLKQRDRNANRLQQNFDILTAILQAVSLKRRVDTRIRFSFIPSPGKKGFRQWHDAFKSIARLPSGILSEWRKRTWLSLAEYCLKDENWNKRKHICFNDRRNPDDDELDTQIVKDLHRTGCSWFFERDTDEEKASLKRVLLAYARWNKSVGYCQGFNVIAALILQVMEGSEEDSLKVMIYLVDYILPRNYFANNLRALSADMAVLRELMSLKLPHLARHLDDLQKASIDTQRQSGSNSYEPPLVNVFTMQWFLTLFATCLPRETVLRVWDAVLLEGSEVLLRVALAIWAKLADYLDHTKTAADFYLKMGSLLQNMMKEEFIDAQKLMQTVFSIAPFPYKKVAELREKYTYDIHPFSTFDRSGSEEKNIGPQVVTDAASDDEGIDSEVDATFTGCFSFIPTTSAEASQPSIVEATPSKTDIAAATPGAVATDPECHTAFTKQRVEAERLREKEKLDLTQLQKQYMRMRHLQKRHMLVFNSFANQKSKRTPGTYQSRAINHLFIELPNVDATGGKQRDNKKESAWNRYPLSTGVKESPEKTLALNIVLQKQESTNKRDKNIKNCHLYPDGDVKNVEYKTGKNSASNHSKSTTAIKSKQKSASREKDSKKIEYDDYLQSSCFKIDKNAMYPVNFQPFPQRGRLMMKSKLIRNSELHKPE